MKRKTTFLFFLLTLLMSHQVKSQTEVIGTLAIMQDHINGLQAQLTQIDGSIVKDKHKEMEGQIHEFKSLLTKITTKSSGLPYEYTNALTLKIANAQKNAEAFEKITHKSTWFDKDKELKRLLDVLKTDTDEIRTTFQSAKSDIESKLESGHQRDHDAIQTAKTPEVKAVPQPVTPSVSPQRTGSLMAIQGKNAQIQVQFTKLKAAFKKNDYKDIVAHGTNISTLCEAMLSSLTDLTEQENSVLTGTVGTLKSEVDELVRVAKKGAAQHSAAHKQFTKVESEATALAAQMSILKQ